MLVRRDFGLLHAPQLHYAKEPKKREGREESPGIQLFFACVAVLRFLRVMRLGGGRIERNIPVRQQTQKPTLGFRVYASCFTSRPEVRLPAHRSPTL